MVVCISDDLVFTMPIELVFRPADTAVDSEAYLQALDAFKPGDACVIFTPDDTHFAMALAAIRRGIHVMITKPAVKTLAEHRQLYEEAQKTNVLVMIEGEIDFNAPPSNIASSSSSSSS